VRPADLEDALQDVFVVVHRRLDSFNGSSLITTWLFGICLRVAVAHRRRAHVRRERTSAELEISLEADTEAGPEALAMARERRRQLELVLDSLEPQRRAFCASTSRRPSRSRNRTISSSKCPCKIA
jgi:RNA polymerase sigma-70 factor (ECF subfamily)